MAQAVLFSSFGSRNCSTLQHSGAAAALPRQQAARRGGGRARAFQDTGGPGACSLALAGGYESSVHMAQVQQGGLEQSRSCAKRFARQWPAAPARPATRSLGAWLAALASQASPNLLHPTPGHATSPHSAHSTSPLAQVTGKCGSVVIRLVPAPRGAGIVAARVPKKVLQMAGIEDCYTSSRGSRKTLGNFVKATYNALAKTYGFLTPDLWRETKYGKTPLQVRA